MNPTLYIGLGGLACAALAVLSRLWLPYDPTGASAAPALQHLAATGAVLAFYALLAGYLALGKTPAAKDASPGRIITTTYLVLAVVLTTCALAGTYWGLSYRAFWALMVLQMLVLAILWVVATQLQGAGVKERGVDTRVRRHRRTQLHQTLARLHEQATSAPLGHEGLIFAKALHRLQEELRLFPVASQGADVEQIERDVHQWAHEAAEQPFDSRGPGDHQRMVQQAQALSCRMADWKST